MKLRSWFGTLADSTPFKDEPLGIHWQEKGDAQILWDDGYRVAYVSKGYGKYRAQPLWNEDEQEFKTQEEAKSWLVAMYKMGGQNEPKQHRRPAAK